MRLFSRETSVAVGLCEIVDREEIDAAIVMDGDGEDRPVEIGTLLAVARQYPGQIVLAERTERSETLRFRFGYFLYKLLFRAMTGRTINFGNYSPLPMPAICVHQMQMSPPLPFTNVTIDGGGRRAFA